MQSRFRLFRRRGKHGRVYYLQDDASGKQESLKTTSKEEAKKILQAREQAVAHPLLTLLNRELANTYLKAADPSLVEQKS